MNDKILNFDEIKAQFPNEWILLKLPNATQSLNKTGVVMYHSADYLELCYKGSEIAKDVLTTIFYTGDQKPTSKWLKTTEQRLMTDYIMAYQNDTPSFGDASKWQSQERSF